MGKSEYKRDWSECDENVITRYELTFPFYVFQHWWESLVEENRDAKKTYKAPKEFNEFPILSSSLGLSGRSSVPPVLSIPLPLPCRVRTSAGTLGSR